jgi:hypothetical protein
MTMKQALITLRNFCCGNELVVPIMIESDAVDQILQFAKTAVRKNSSLGHGNDDEEEEEEGGSKPRNDLDITIDNLPDEEISQLLSFSCQFLSNFVSTSPVLADFMVDQVGDSLLHLLAATQRYKNPKAIGILWGILFSVICDSKFGHERRIQKLFSYRSLLCGMFLSLQSLHNPTQPSSSSPTLPQLSTNEADPMNEWTQLFILQILKQGKTTELFNLLDSKNSESLATSGVSSYAIVNLEQVIL